MADNDLSTKVAVLIEHVAGLETATSVNSIEILRRLDELNHAHERAQEVAHTYVTLDKYEANREAEAMALKLALDRRDNQIGTLETFKNRALGAAVVLAGASGLIGAVIAQLFK